MSEIAGGVRGGRSDFELPDEILSVIPTDPFEQLDLAKKITSMAIASKVSNLEAEVIEMKQKLHEREVGIHELEWKASRLERDFREADSMLKMSLHENMNLRKERDSLEATANKLRCDVAKLETFKRQLIQSLSNENVSVNETEPADIRTCDQSVPRWFTPVNASEYTGPRLSVTPYISPWVTPTIISPRSNYAAGSPRRTSGERENTILWCPSSQQSSASNSPPRAFPLSARIDGKEFFRQARSRLSYEQFRAFLANIKELNAHKQTREETLRRAGELLGAENKDLYLSFQGLVTKNKT
ncbi:unnamed protein product [Thlaspi arvense]|uniref:At4g15545-like C-terminal domain-containing protein n=1 Tax=Thlaspi arvense TaxID=13288 RepID=A0AAU9SK42_THLAR|nr:unnamed protein product [Thlaspi arvense]